MLVVTRTGDPRKVVGPAFRELYRICYCHAEKDERRVLKAPLARWAPASIEEDKRTWVGRYALAVSSTFPRLNEESITVVEWEYGLVAEILHDGPYSQEPTTLEKLKGFIAR